MIIDIRTTPNPDTQSFYPRRSVLPWGGPQTLNLRSLDEATHSPLGHRLLGLDGVLQVFLAQDFVSITRAPGADWAILSPRVETALRAHYACGEPAVEEDAPEAQELLVLDVDPEDAEVAAEIEDLIAERVRPAVLNDGGDIVLVGYHYPRVALRMNGACTGCPSSSATLKLGVQNLLRHYIDPNLVVEEA